jgi:hypothetical protein
LVYLVDRTKDVSRRQRLVIAFFQYRQHHLSKFRIVHKQFEQVLFRDGDLGLGYAFHFAADGLGRGLAAVLYGTPQIAFQAGIIDTKEIHRLVKAFAFLDRVLDRRDDRNNIFYRLRLVPRVCQ